MRSQTLNTVLTLFLAVASLLPGRVTGTCCCFWHHLVEASSSRLEGGNSDTDRSSGKVEAARPGKKACPKCKPKASAERKGGPASACCSKQLSKPRQPNEAPSDSEITCACNCSCSDWVQREPVVLLPKIQLEGPQDQVYLEWRMLDDVRAAHCLLGYRPPLPKTSSQRHAWLCVWQN
jgi:hypothetical protein